MVSIQLPGLDWQGETQGEEGFQVQRASFSAAPQGDTDSCSDLAPPVPGTRPCQVLHMLAPLQQST